MKNLFLLVILSVVFVGLTSAQTIKTVEARQLEDVDTRIKLAQHEIDLKKLDIKKLLTKYTEEYREVVAIKAQIEVLKENLLPLLAERKRLADGKLTMALPNNQIELLKILILQNERLLDLLNNQIPKNN